MNNNRSHHTIPAISISAVVLFAVILYITASVGNGKPKVINGIYFNTVVSIEIFDRCDDSIIQSCTDICDRYDKLFNAQSEDSEIYRINRSVGKTEISKETYDLLFSALKYENETEGAFSPCIYPLVSLWGITSDDPSVPSDPEINETLLKCADNVKLYAKDAKYYVDINGSMIDAGAIAKGYIGNRLREYLTENGIKHALINLGGNVIVLNSKTSGEDFKIAVRDPLVESEKPLLVIECEDTSIVSSGQYERNFTENGKTYGHILDINTGYPVDNDLASVTIISHDSEKADAYSTACFVMGSEKGMDFINSLSDVHAIFVKKDGSIIYSDSFPYPVNKL